MRKSAVFVFVLIVLHSCRNIPDAADLKHGKFFYYTKERQKIIVIRTDSMHIELDPVSGKSLVLNINWKSDSAYFISRRIKASTIPDSSGKIYAPVFSPRKIIMITPEYYIVIPTHDKYSFAAANKDTVWIDELCN